MVFCFCSHCGSRSAQDAAPGRGAPPAVNAAYVRENYTKFEYRIPMRDGVKLFTSVYIPKDVFSDGKTYPIMMQRTPYNVQPVWAGSVSRQPGTVGIFRAGEIHLRLSGHSRTVHERRRVQSAAPASIRRKGRSDIDESSDTYDTIDWLVKNVPGNNGKVGMWGISQPGFYATAGMIDAHPALVAVSPQAPVTDYYMGDDVYHNGAFMLAHRFGFYQGFRQREGDPAPPPRRRALRLRDAGRLRFLSEPGLAGQCRREIFQAPAAAVDAEHRAHHL